MLNVFNKEEKVQGINRTRDERINNLENSNSIIGEDDKVEYKKTGIERWNVRSFYDTNSVISTKNRIFGRCGDKKPITMCFVARDPISLTIEVGLSVTSPPLLCFATLTIQIGDDLPFGRVVNGTRSECLSSFTLR
ncbi:hypothetical protein QE152_g35208 [Popillia japonica]|uniref:Uncharacterized protein n=1 Tax=Popillia japonica TaxID=7064 RepID=A0AAW1IG56_POPJA